MKNGLRCAPLIIAALSLLGFSSVAFGHRLDEYLQATLVVIAQGDIRLQINFTPGVEIADQILALIDHDRDNTISETEAAAYSELVKRDLVVRIDGQPAILKLTLCRFDQPNELRTGSGLIQLEYLVNAGPTRAGVHQFTFENRHLPKLSVYLLNAAKPSSDSVRITSQKRNEIQSTGQIGFIFR